MGIFDVINGASNAIGQFSGALGGGNQLVPPLEVDDNGLIGDGFDWLSSQFGGLGTIPANLLKNSYNPVAVRQAITGVPFGGTRPINNINTQFNVSSKEQEDWRVRLTISNGKIPLTGILSPLSKSAGLIFPYTPQIETSYTADYEDVHPTHSNYNTPAYSKSKVGEITITADFTANDSEEASYAIAAIHFFRTITKMYYANDEGMNGSPPPILSLNGYGSYMFKNVPVVCRNASVTLPQDVDYVMANPGSLASASTSNKVDSLDALFSKTKDRINKSLPSFLRDKGTKNSTGPNKQNDYTWVPSKFSITSSFNVIYSRTGIANKFSLQKFASGDLTKNNGFI